MTLDWSTAQGLPFADSSDSVSSPQNPSNDRIHDRECKPHLWTPLSHTQLRGCFSLLRDARRIDRLRRGNPRPRSTIMADLDAVLRQENRGEITGRRRRTKQPCANFRGHRQSRLGLRTDTVSSPHSRSNKAASKAPTTTKQQRTNASSQPVPQLFYLCPVTSPP